MAGSGRMEYKASGAEANCGWTNAARGRAPGRTRGWYAAAEGSLGDVAGAGRPGGDAGGDVVVEMVEGDPGGEDWGCSEETVG